MPPKAAAVPTSSPRRHIVLVPGFAGFDALGQLEYYARVTPQFRAWQSNGGRADTALHYFDNFPTASVATRARLLRNYLAKRILRGEIAGGDTIALVGHSTAGLDIRRLVWHLGNNQAEQLRFDGAAHADLTPATLLRMIRRVAFLSVPHWGTNIADWVHDHACPRKAVIAELRAIVCTSQVPLLSKLEESVAAVSSSLSRVDLLYALQDALAEAEVCARRDDMATALAQAAASQLALWLRHMATDFGAIDDLSARVPHGGISSPAHFDEPTRAREKEFWRDIEFQSYITVGRRPFPFNEHTPAPTWDLLNPCSYPECAKDRAMSAGTDIVYRTCYRGCAGGPFKIPNEPDLRALEPWIGTPPARIAVWDNDGIVNTASMVWPGAAQNFLIAADHADIIGHFERVLAPRKSARTYEAYDLMKSHSGFDYAAFTKVWQSVFDFCG